MNPSIIPPASLAASGFACRLAGMPGARYAVETSTNLADWLPLATNTSPFSVTDGDATNFPVRYYRAVYLP